jgi:hypothetical protein
MKTPPFEGGFFVGAIRTIRNTTAIIPAEKALNSQNNATYAFEQMPSNSCVSHRWTLIAR